MDQFQLELMETLIDINAKSFPATTIIQYLTLLTTYDKTLQQFSPKHTLRSKDTVRRLIKLLSNELGKRYG